MKLKKKGLQFFRGVTWTIDAPYRETKAELQHYKKLGISTVEMEASAMFAVAKYRKVKIASAFVVSDILGTKWVPKFHKLDVKRTLNKLDRLFTQQKNPVIFISHNVPYNTNIDIIKNKDSPRGYFS